MGHCQGFRNEIKIICLLSKKTQDVKNVCFHQMCNCPTMACQECTKEIAHFYCLAHQGNPKRILFFRGPIRGSQQLSIPISGLWRTEFSWDSLDELKTKTLCHFYQGLDRPNVTTTCVLFTEACLKGERFWLTGDKGIKGRGFNCLLGKAIPDFWGPHGQYTSYWYRYNSSYHQH